MWTIIKNENAFIQALSLCKGKYQRDFIKGLENLSGSTLKGKAKDYGSRYARSRNNLLNRLKQNNVPFHEEIGEHNKRILVLGE